MPDITQILSEIEKGNPQASSDLLPLVYDELRRLASAKLAQEKPGQTIQATALVHDAYLRLVDNKKTQEWNSRGHFFSAAAEAMRRILVENARRKLRGKHGGDWQRVHLDQAATLSHEPSEHLVALDAAIELLAAEAPEKAQLVKLRYFAGLSHQEAAKSLGISRATADRYWTYAKLFLYTEMNSESADKKVE